MFNLVYLCAPPTVVPVCMRLYMANLDTDHTYVGGMVYLNLGDCNAQRDHKFHNFVANINCWSHPVLWPTLLDCFCFTWHLIARSGHVMHHTVCASLVFTVGVTMKLL